MFSWISYASCLKGRSPALPILGVLLHLCPHPLTQNDHVRQGYTWGRGVLCGSATPPIPRGRPSSPQFLGFYLSLHYLTQNDHVRQDNTCGEGRVSWVQPRLPSRGRSISAPQFFGFSVFTLFDVERPNWVWKHTRGGAYFRGSATALHKCVARFVSDSRVSCNQKLSHILSYIRASHVCWRQMLTSVSAYVSLAPTDKFGTVGFRDRYSNMVHFDGILAC